MSPSDATGDDVSTSPATSIGAGNGSSTGGSAALGALARIRNSLTTAPLRHQPSIDAPTISSASSHFEGPATSLSTGYKTGTKIRSLDINDTRTHAVLAGISVLKIVRIDDDSATCAEDFNVRSAVLDHDFGGASHDPQQGPRPLYEAYDLDTAKRDLFDIESVAWSIRHYRDYLATSARNGKIVIYNIAKPGCHVLAFHDHMRQVHKLKFSPLDGRLLLSGSQDGMVKLWDLRNQRCVSTVKGLADGVRDVAWSPIDGLAFAFGTDNGTVQHWTLKYPREAVRKISAHDQTCSSIDWHPSGRHLASGGHDKTVKVWDMSPEPASRGAIVNLRTPQQIQNLAWRPGCVTLGDDARHATQLATSYRQHPFVHIWDLRRPSVAFRECTHRANAGTTGMLWRSRDLLWAVGPDGEFEQFDMAFTTLMADRRRTALVKFSNRGELAVVTGAPSRRNPDLELNHERSMSASTAAAASASASASAPASAPDKPEVPLVRSGSDVVRHSSSYGSYARTPEDEGVDDRFLTLNPRRKRGSMSAGSILSGFAGASVPGMSKKSLLGTSPDDKRADDTDRRGTVDLAASLSKYKPWTAAQSLRVCTPPGLRPRDTFQYLAQTYTLPLRETPLHSHAQRMADVQAALARNGESARRANEHREAQVWAVLAHVLGREDSKLLRATSSSTPNGTASSRHWANGHGHEGNEAEPGITSSSDPEQSEIHTKTKTTKPNSTRAGGQRGIGGITDITAKNIVCQLLDYYASQQNWQLASHLILQCVPYLWPPTPENPGLGHLHDGEAEALSHQLVKRSPDTLQSAGTALVDSFSRAIHDGVLNAAQIEALLAEYHAQLQVSRSHLAAAELRKLCVPLFPAVYEDAAKDVTMGLRCGACGKPNNNRARMLECEHCGAVSAPCAYCNELSSPFEEQSGPVTPTQAADQAGIDETGQEDRREDRILDGLSTSADITASPDRSHDPRVWSGGSKLWTFCPLCGHCIHFACSLDLWSEQNVIQPGWGGGCPVAGCRCACVPGALRVEYERSASGASASAAHARRGPRVSLGNDERVGESRAVGKVRSALRESLGTGFQASSGTGSTSGPSSGPVFATATGAGGFGFQLGSTASTAVDSLTGSSLSPIALATSLGTGTSGAPYSSSLSMSLSGASSATAASMGPASSPGVNLSTQGTAPKKTVRLVTPARESAV